MPGCRSEFRSDFIHVEKVHFPVSGHPPYDSASFRYPNGEAGYAGSGTGKGSYDKIFRRYVQNATGYCNRKKRQYP